MAEKRNQPEGTKHPRDRGPAPDAELMISIARRVTEATGQPVVGGVAVILHGGGRSTYDIDIYSDDNWATHLKLSAAGVVWDQVHREHLLDGKAIHLVGPDSLGGAPKRISTIQGVKVIGLADLIRGKLTVGLDVPGRFKDLAHVEDLIARIPLGKDFAAKLPTHLRAPFKKLVEGVEHHRAIPAPGTPIKIVKKYSSTPRARKRATEMLSSMKKTA